MTEKTAALRPMARPSTRTAVRLKPRERSSDRRLKRMSSTNEVMKASSAFTTEEDARRFGATGETPIPPSHGTSSLLDEGAVLELTERLAQFRLRVHHDWPVPRHRLLDRLARHEQEPDALVSGLDD